MYYVYHFSLAVIRILYNANKLIYYCMQMCLWWHRCDYLKCIEKINTQIKSQSFKLYLVIYCDVLLNKINPWQND